MSDGPERKVEASGPTEGPARQPPATLLVGTLGFLAVFAGLAIVLVYEWANPQIEAHRARELQAAIQEVLGGPESYETRWVHEGALLDSLPAGQDSASATPVYAGYDGTGALVGYAVAGEKVGYQDVIRLIFGYDPRSDEVVGMKVLESKETPGLGSKIQTDSTFLRAFHGAETPLLGVKDGAQAPGEIDMITGATISSEAVIDIINERLGAVGTTLRDGAEATALQDDEGASASGGGSAARVGGDRKAPPDPGVAGATAISEGAATSRRASGGSER